MASVLVGDAAPQHLGGGADGLLEQGQQQLVLAAEVLVEAAQRLPGALDDLLDGEVLLALVHQLERSVEVALDRGSRLACGPSSGIG